MMRAPAISAYVPFFNNAATVRQAVESVFAQTLPPLEVLVVDDGSSDDSVARLAGLPVKIIRHAQNLGRGAARAAAMQEARGELVLSVDATNVLAPDFLARGRAWFDEPRVAAVFGRLQQGPTRRVADRWRGRHLFKVEHAVPDLQRRAVLTTYGAIVRAESVRAVGGYSPALRHNEDGDLGTRLLAAGHDVFQDAAMALHSISSDTVGRVLERYWRWNEATRPPSLGGYFRQVKYSLQVMARADLARGEARSAAISLACPHYCLVRSLLQPRRERSAAS